MAAGCVRERAASRGSGVESVGLCESVGVWVCACVSSWTERVGRVQGTRIVLLLDAVVQTTVGPSL